MTPSLILARCNPDGVWTPDPRAYTEDDAHARATQLRTLGFRVRVSDFNTGRFVIPPRSQRRDYDREREQRKARADVINARRRELRAQRKAQQ